MYDKRRICDMNDEFVPWKGEFAMIDRFVLYRVNILLWKVNFYRRRQLFAVEGKFGVAGGRLVP